MREEPTAPARATRTLIRIGYWALIGYAATAPFSILVSQAFLVLGLLALLARARGFAASVRAAGMSWYAAATAGFAGLTLLSCVFSLSPRESFADSKSLLLLLIPFAALLFLASPVRWRWFLVVFGTATAVASLYGLWQYGYELGARGLATRAHGFFSIYTTYGQFVMLAGAFAMGVWISRAAAALRAAALGLWLVATAAMAVSFVRGAWVGMFAALAALVLGYRRRWLFLLPVSLLLVAITAPPLVFSRMMSIFSLHDQSNRDRIDLVLSGARMVADHPLLGVGPNMVSRAYVLYREVGSFPRVSPHLHNNVAQLAAERGLPALALWCAMMVAFLLPLCRRISAQIRAGRPAALLLGAFAAAVSFLAAGMFDFNFGDSEVVMPFLALMAIPFGLPPDS